MLRPVINSKVQRIDENICESRFDNCLVLFDRESGSYYNFNRIWGELWDWLKTPRQIDELATMISTRYACTQEQCKPDILVWLEHMAAEGLIKVVYCVEL